MPIDPDLLQAYHEAAHTVAAVALNWEIGTISLERVEMRPREEDGWEGEMAVIDLAGDIALAMKFGLARKSEDELLALLYNVRSGGLEKLDDGHYRCDHADALSRLADGNPDAGNGRLLRLYHGHERRARSILKEHWLRVEEVAATLLHHRSLSKRQRLWMHY